MPQCCSPARYKIRITRACRGHAKRVVQFLFGRFFPFQLVRFRCRNAAFRHTKIRVRVMRAETAPRMLIAQSTQSFRALETQILEQVASMLGQAAAMRVHVANGDLASYPRIEHCECWIEYADLRVPSYFSFTDEPGYHGRANRLGKRGELKDCVRVDWHSCARIAHAKSFRV